MAQQRRPAGMPAFSIVWIGQIVSVLATGMTTFGMTIWMYEKTHSVTAMGLVQVFFITPFLLISPLAGVMVDRYNRKLMMIVSDLTVGLGTSGILVLVALGRLEPWHLYVAAGLNGIGNTFQWPAYSAAITTMVPKAQLGRANGMMSLIEAVPGVVAPLLAGVLLPVIGLTGILLIDVATFVSAIATVLVVYVPQPPQTEASREAQGSLAKQVAYGFKFIFARPSLLGLQLVFFAGNLFSNISITLLAPMILARTAQNTLALGSIGSAGAMGGVVGGIVMSAWGGFKRRVHGVLLGWILASFFGMILMGMGQALPVWLAAIAIASLFTPLIDGSNQAIWQAKVAPDVQGRVFSTRRLIAWFANPIAPLIAGGLADLVFEPGMRAPQGVWSLFSGLVGSGPGAGMGLLTVFCGVGGALVGLSGYFVPAIRNSERLLPDFDQVAPAGQEL